MLSGKWRPSCLGLNVRKKERCETGLDGRQRLTTWVCRIHVVYYDPTDLKYFPDGKCVWLVMSVSPLAGPWYTPGLGLPYIAMDFLGHLSQEPL